MASMTKLLTSLAVLHLIQEGSLSLDTDVTPHLPVLASLQILTAADGDGKQKLAPRTKPLLVRHLLTHSAGTGYVFLSEPLVAWYQATHGRMPNPIGTASEGGGTTVDQRFAYPLLHEPGQGWVYGSALDWAGRLVEVVSGQKLEDYIYDNVLSKVGVPRGGITFYPGKFGKAVADLSTRNPEDGEGKMVPMDTGFPHADADAFGGQGMYGGMGEYIKVLESILKDDGKILRPEVAKLLFEGLLEPEAKKALNEELKKADWVIGVVPPGVEYNWSAGGLLSEGGSLGHRKKGFLQWGGVWNLAWVSNKETAEFPVMSKT
jgi:CubicO group peptidase (beta-lactamase class C family)